MKLNHLFKLSLMVVLMGGAANALDPNCVAIHVEFSGSVNPDRFFANYKGCNGHPQETNVWDQLVPIGKNGVVSFTEMLGRITIPRGEVKVGENASVNIVCTPVGCQLKP